MINTETTDENVMRSYILVGIQFGILGFLFWYGGVFGDVFSSILMGLALLIGFSAVITMRFRVSIFPEVRLGQQLFTGGMYHFIRHPMYVSVLLLALAWVLNRVDAVTISVWVVLLIDLLIKLSFEEKELSRKFPEYQEYMRTSKRMIPWVY